MNNLIDLKELIDKVYKTYIKVCKDWENNRKLPLFNQVKVTINDVFEQLNLFVDIFQYRDFLNNKEVDEILYLSTLNNIEHMRVKQFNSILFKLVNYQTKLVNGKSGTIALNKCLNDILGLRVITEKAFAFEDVRRMVKENYLSFKCIEAIRGEYKAIHIYIKEDNYHYLWEIQLWYIDDVKKNYESHKQHKQAYTKWEELFKNIKGGLQ